MLFSFPLEKFIIESERNKITYGVVVVVGADSRR